LPVESHVAGGVIRQTISLVVCVAGGERRIVSAPAFPVGDVAELILLIAVERPR
jgi:hypothetical protein